MTSDAATASWPTSTAAAAAGLAAPATAICAMFSGVRVFFATVIDAPSAIPASLVPASTSSAVGSVGFFTWVGSE